MTDVPFAQFRTIQKVGDLPAGATMDVVLIVIFMAALTLVMILWESD